MATLTVSIPDELKKDIFERYVKTGELSDEDGIFCERIDWHPVDELPLKDEFINELEKAKDEPSDKSMILEELYELMGLKWHLLFSKDSLITTRLTSGEFLHHNIHKPVLSMLSH